MLIRKECSPGKFSVYVTAFMISACILKVMFFFITPYSLVLFIQNFLIIALCVSQSSRSWWSSTNMSSTEVMKEKTPPPSLNASGNGLTSRIIVFVLLFSLFPGLLYHHLGNHNLPEYCQWLAFCLSFLRDGQYLHRDLRCPAAGHRYSPC